MKVHHARNEHREHGHAVEAGEFRQMRFGL
jgi:hypothetical protein